jgi:hypothetical protein
MKRVLICTAMLVCSAVLHAQLKTIPSFREYLNKQQVTPFIKPYVFNNPGINYKGYDALNKAPRLKINDSKKHLKEEMKSSDPLMGSFAGVLPNGNKLYILPQDNMPCIVPDLSQFKTPVDKRNNHLDEKINGSIGNN